MGAFFLYNSDVQINEIDLKKHFFEANFANPLIVKLNRFTLYLYKKQSIEDNNFIQRNGISIFACGSFFYKGLSYSESLNRLHLDYINSRLDRNELYGNYIIIFYHKKRESIEVFIDPTITKNIYSDVKYQILSSSLLAIKAASAQVYTTNLEAIIENLTSGNLISPDTYYNEIIRIDEANIDTLNKRFNRIQVHPNHNQKYLEINDRETAIENANDKINEYFKNAKSISEEFGAHIGITGGLDSRLLLMHAKININKLIGNSFWRKNSIEYEYAKLLAKEAKLEFNSFEKSEFSAPSPLEQLKQAYIFFDGQIRSQNYWSEEFNNPSYGLQLANNHFVGFHGCGGEQYRNADRMIRSISLEKYIKYEWIFKQSKNPFLDREWEHLIIGKINNKIRRLVEIPNEKIRLTELKKIQNQIWNNANRTTRVNAMNQQMFYFAPFVEANLSIGAYKYIPFLGHSMEFQLAMMKNADPVLSKVPTVYGFNIHDGEPFRKKIIAFLYNSLPRKISHKIYLEYKIYNTDRKYTKLCNSDSAFKAAMQGIINLDVISKSEILGKNLDSFCYYYDTI